MIVLVRGRGLRLRLVPHDRRSHGRRLGTPSLMFRLFHDLSLHPVTIHIARPEAGHLTDSSHRTDEGEGQAHLSVL